jgi:glycosyltransferase involved in cell wall biosynthesis
MFYDGFVPEEEYNDTMRNVDFLVLPIKILSRGVGVTPEYYGTTKGSAAVFEAIQYARPMVVPDEFNMLSEMQSSTVKYKNAGDMADQISKLVENQDKIKSLQKEAYMNSEKFNLDKLQKYFTEEIIEKFDSL